MDELTLLRTVGEDVAEPSAETLDRARRALVDRIGSRPVGGRSRHRALKRASWIGGSTVAVAGIAVALVLSNVVGVTGWRGGADGAAAAALDDAAAATITTSDPIVGPGQYLEVSTQAVYSVTSGSGPAETSYLTTQDGQLYVPARRDDDWVWVRDPSAIAKTFGQTSENAANASIAAHPSGPDIIRAAKGAFYNGQPTDWGLDALPRNPQRLLNYIYRTTAGHGVSRDGEALVFIADTLRTGVVPADLRAALYKAVAGIPGVTISDREATLDGRTGIAYGRDEGNGLRQEIIIDPATGQLIGEREIVLRDDVMPGIPAGESIGWTAVTTTVTDSAPSGGTVCGSGSHPVGGAGSAMCSDDSR